MSNTGYNVNSLDLIYIFQPYTSGTIVPTGFTSGGADLANTFQPWDGTSSPADVTGYIANGFDLNTIFQNLHSYVVTNYNPFSANTTATGYTYNIFSVNGILSLTQNVNNAYIFLIGGGGGGGSGTGYEGGGAGGTVTVTLGPVSLAAGSYTITIGNGGAGGAYIQGLFRGFDGQPGGTTSMSYSGSGFTPLTAAGGGGGGSGDKFFVSPNIGLGGTNGNSSNQGFGGTHNVTVPNVQGNGNGYGYNGYQYMFQDGTSTTFNFGGGGGSGGRNSSSIVPSAASYGGGGLVGSYGSGTFTAETGGCGGTGSPGISTFPGFDYTFNGITYNTGSGGGGGGNSDSFDYSPGGQGNQGLAIIYYPTYIWSALGSGVGVSSGTFIKVEAIAIDSNNNVYVGGYFTIAGGVSANYIAMWNPTTSTWSTLNDGDYNGVDYQVEAIAIDSNNNVYIGGVFQNVGGITAKAIAMWNPNTSTWSNLGSSTELNASVNSIAIDSNNNVYVGGNFTIPGINYMGMWNGTTWSGLTNPGFNDTVMAIAIDSNNNVYVGGFFTSPTNYIAVWNPNNSTWSSLGYGVNGTVYSIAIDSNNNVYVGGAFDYAGGVLINSTIAMWNQTAGTWSALGVGVNSDTDSIAIDSNNNVYVGGYFTSAGGNPANRIAMWNGNTWSTLGIGVNNTVYSIAIDSNNNVYAGGYITEAAGIPVNYIAKYGSQ